MCCVGGGWQAVKMSGINGIWAVFCKRDTVVRSDKKEIDDEVYDKT